MIDARQLYKLIKNALAEDVNTGDITTESTVPPGTQISGRFLAKSTGVLCGTEVVKAVFAYVDADIRLEFHFGDGDMLKAGDVIADIRGDAAHISSQANARRSTCCSICRVLPHAPGKRWSLCGTITLKSSIPGKPRRDYGCLKNMRCVQAEAIITAFRWRTGF